MIRAVAVTPAEDAPGFDVYVVNDKRVGTHVLRIADRAEANRVCNVLASAIGCTARTLDQAAKQRAS